MDVEGDPVRHKESAQWFVELCIEKFGWSDLSSDVVMDVGCGVEGFCGTAILDKFPDVRSILGIEVNLEAVDRFMPMASTKMSCEFGDIQNSETLQHFKGKMNKVVVTHVFHQLREKEKAFRNVFEILKPGGEAGVLFVVHALIDDWYKEMLKTPKWKEAYKGPDIDAPKKRAGDYREMVQKIGFKVIHCQEREKLSPYPSLESSRETLFEMCKSDFDIPSGLTDEFKTKSIILLLKMSPVNAKGKLSYRQTELSLLLKKPA